MYIYIYITYKYTYRLRIRFAGKVEPCTETQDHQVAPNHLSKPSTKHT